MSMPFHDTELASLLDELDNLVARCAQGGISFDAFLDLYGYPMGEYALDGHESNEAERAVLQPLAGRIRFHELLAEKVLAHLSSPDQALDPAYQACGRIGLDVAARLLRELWLGRDAVGD